MSEPAQKCENYAILKQNYTLELCIAFKMAYSCCFSLGGNLDFPDFLQKKFYNIEGCWSLLPILNMPHGTKGCALIYVGRLRQTKKAQLKLLLRIG